MKILEFYDKKTFQRRYSCVTWSLQKTASKRLTTEAAAHILFDQPIETMVARANLLYYCNIADDSFVGDTADYTKLLRRAATPHTRAAFDVAELHSRNAADHVVRTQAKEFVKPSVDDFPHKKCEENQKATKSSTFCLLTRYSAIKYPQLIVNIACVLKYSASKTEAESQLFSVLVPNWRVAYQSSTYLSQIGVNWRRCRRRYEVSPIAPTPSSTRLLALGDICLDLKVAISTQEAKPDNWSFVDHSNLGSRSAIYCTQRL